MSLDSVRVVLIETSHPGNIGAAARAMKNMGLSRLVLVNPARHPTEDARARASGADSVLADATVAPSLPAAIAGCHLVIGASARRRGISCPELDPRQSAAEIRALDGAAQAALVFGRERAGLTNDELDCCHYALRIPANPGFSSLNLAAAVQVCAYELRMAYLQAESSGESGCPEPAGILAKARIDRPAGPPADGQANDRMTTPASGDEMQRFFEHLERALLQAEFLNPENPRHLMRRLRVLFNRAQPDQREVNILRGILSALEKSQK